jgi:hypothetical protein
MLHLNLHDVHVVYDEYVCHVCVFLLILHVVYALPFP